MAFSGLKLLLIISTIITVTVKAQFDQASFHLMSTAVLEWPWTISVYDDELGGDKDQDSVLLGDSSTGKQNTITYRMELLRPTGFLVHGVQGDLIIPTIVTEPEQKLIPIPEAAPESPVAGYRFVLQVLRI